MIGYRIPFYAVNLENNPSSFWGGTSIEQITMNELSGTTACEKLDLCESFRTRLDNKKIRLEGELSDTNRLLALMEKNPEIQEILSLAFKRGF